MPVREYSYGDQMRVISSDNYKSTLIRHAWRSGRTFFWSSYQPKRLFAMPRTGQVHVVPEEFL